MQKIAGKLFFILPLRIAMRVRELESCEFSVSTHAVRKYVNFSCNVNDARDVTTREAVKQRKTTKKKKTKDGEKSKSSVYSTDLQNVAASL